jgi:signal transduction histidine kinase
MTNVYILFNKLLLVCFTCFATIACWKFRQKESASFRFFAIGNGISKEVITYGLIISTFSLFGITTSVIYNEKFKIEFLELVLVIFLSWIVAQKLYTFDKDKFRGCLSISHIMNRLYGTPGRIITNVISLTTDISILVILLDKAGLIISNLLHLSHVKSVIISALLTIGFCLTGGVRMHMKLGFIIISLLFILSPLFYIYLMDLKVDILNLGAGNFLQNLIVNNSQSNLEILLLFAALPYCNSSFIQKCLAANSVYQLKSSLKSAAVYSIPVAIMIWLMIPATNGLVNLYTPHHHTYALSEYIIGILGVVIFISITSCCTGILHAHGVVVANDIVRALHPGISHKALIICAKTSMLVAVVFSISLTIFADKFDFLKMQLLWIPLIMLPLCMRFLRFKISNNSFIGSSAVASIIMGACYYYKISNTLSVSLGCIGWVLATTAKIIFTKQANLFHILTPWNYLNSLFNLIRYKCILIKQLFTYTTRIINLFPLLSKTGVDQRNILSRFSIISVLYCFTCLSLMHKTGLDHITIALWLIAGVFLYIITMHKVIFIDYTNSLLFRILWYSGLIVIFPVISTYAILVSSDNVMIIIMSIFAQISFSFFTNSHTFTISSLLGFLIAVALLIFRGAHVEYACLMNAVVTTSLNIAFGIFLVKNREDKIIDELERIQMMSGAMAHEVKSPLATNYSYITTVQELISMGKVQLKKAKTLVTFENDVFKDLNEFVNLSVEVADHSIKAVDTLLLNIREDIDTLKLYEVSVLKCVQSAVESYIPTHYGSKERIIIEVMPDLKVIGLPIYIEQLVRNLIKNAFVHGGGRVTVKVYNEEYRLIVEDNGKGIPPEIIPMIFDRFYSRTCASSGIGLSFCKMVMNAFGGTLYCESDPGNFTRFIMLFPRPNWVDQKLKHDLFIESNSL